MFGTYHMSFSCLGELGQEQTQNVSGSKTGLGEYFTAIMLMNGSQVSRSPRLWGGNCQTTAKPEWEGGGALNLLDENPKQIMNTTKIVFFSKYTTF